MKRSESDNTIVDVEILTTDKLYSMAELCRICQLNESGLREYVEYGIIMSETTGVYRFSQSQLDRLLRGTRLQRDLELNHAGVALALDLLDTIEELNRNLSRLQR